jgi:hypothetical protein
MINDSIDINSKSDAPSSDRGVCKAEISCDSEDFVTQSTAAISSRNSPPGRRPDGRSLNASICLGDLRTSTPLPILLQKLGLGTYAKPSCRSPLRNDSKPSWGIYSRSNGTWGWKDHGTGDGGDEITFLARLHNLDVRKDFRELLCIYEEVAKKEIPGGHDTTAIARSCPSGTPDTSGARRSTGTEIGDLCKARGFNVPGTKWAEDRGVLVFGEYSGFLVYGVTDQSHRSLEWRRTDGRLFPASQYLPERKSHSVKGSQKSWPLGILEAKEVKTILLCEGAPDFIGAHSIIYSEGHQDLVAPVAMLAATVSINEEALEYFAGKSIFIVPHQDKVGIAGAKNWGRQLSKVASKVEYFDLRRASGDSAVKDICDYLPCHEAGKNSERRVLA